MSRLLAVGVSLAEVARRIGDSPATVIRTYAHWMPGAVRAVADLVNDIYGGGGATFTGERQGTEAYGESEKTGEMAQWHTLAYSAV